MNLINGRTAFVAVVYNAIWFETNAAASLTKAGISKDDIFLFDNSDKEEFIEANSKCMLARYMGFGKNVGLSKAYNLSVSKIRKLTEYSEIVFMDADTSFPASYFTFVGKNHDTNKLWVPIVEDANRPEVIVSPNEKRFLKNKFVEKKNLEKIVKINAINSGMVVGIDIFNDISFDERLFLDEVDTAFFDKARLERVQINIMPLSIKQNFSASTVSDSEGSKNRFKLRATDLLIYFKNEYKFGLFFGSLKVVLLGIRNYKVTQSQCFVIIAIKAIAQNFFERDSN